MLEIPDSVARAMRLPFNEQRNQLLQIELAVSLYAQHILSFGKARELAGVNGLEFGILLGRRNITRQYAEQDMQDDISYASR